MADSNRLSGTVTEDAVPLELLGETSLTSTSAPEGSITSRPHHQISLGSSVPQSSQQTRITESRLHGLEAAREMTAERSGQRRSGDGMQDSHQSSQPPSQTVPPMGSAGHSVSDASSSHQDEDVGRDIFKGVSKAMEKAMSEAVLYVENPSLPFSSEPSPLESSMKSLTLLPEPVDDEDIEKYRSRMPDGLKLDHYDAMILYQDDDLPVVKKFLNRVEAEVLLNKVEKPKVVLYDNILPDAGISKVGELDKTLEYCTYVFLYVTKKFCQGRWTEFAAQTALMNAIDSPQSRWSVVPIFTEPKRNPTFKIPPSIRSLKGIQYWSDDKFYADSLRKLLEDKLHVRLDKEEDLREKRKDWIRKYKQSERRKAEERNLQDRHAQELEAEEERKHQQVLQFRDREFQVQKIKREQQQRINICSLQDAIKQLECQGSSSQNTSLDEYFQNLSQHMNAPNSASPKKSESVGGHLEQQGMAELSHLRPSFSMPNYRCHQFPPPTISFLSQFAGMAPPPHPVRLPQGYPSEWTAPSSAYQSARYSVVPASLPPGDRFYLPDSSASSCPPGPKSLPINSGEKRHVSGTDFPSAPVQAEDGGPSVKDYPDVQTCTSQSSESGPRAEEQGAAPAGSRNVGHPGVGDGKDQAGPRITGDCSAHEGHDHGLDDTSHNSLGREDNPKMPHKEDLVEDVPMDSSNPQSSITTSYSQNKGCLGQPHFSEAIHQPAILSQGPAHLGSRRAQAEPDGRGDNRCDPHLMYSGHAEMGDRFSGYRPPFPYGPPGQYRSPPPGQFHSPYMPHHPHPYFLGHFAPEFYPGQYPYPGQAPAYAMFPQYGVQRFHSPAAVPVQHIDNLQYPGQYQTSWPPSPLPTPRAAAPAAPAANRQQAPSTQQEENPSPPVIHHHHFHHGRGEEGSTTVNYINKAENVMVGEQISVEKRKKRHGAEQYPEAEEAQSLPENIYVRENPCYTAMPPPSSGGVGDERSHDLTMTEESVTLTPSPAYSYESQPELAAFREQSTSSRLTGNVSRDNNSRGASVQSAGSGSAAAASSVGLPEVTSESYHPTYAGQMPHTSTSISSPHQFLPLQGPPHSSAGSTMSPENIVQQWPEQYEQERETQLKRYVMGPSAEEDCYLSEDWEDTSKKTVGSKT